MKKILGITALLAVVALCLAFTACPLDEDIRTINFINETRLDITLTFTNVEQVLLGGIRANGEPVTAGRSPKATRTLTGKDIILTTIAIGSLSDDEIEKYIDIVGMVTPGKNSNKGVSLGSGTMTFKAITGVSGGNPATPQKIDTIMLDD